MTDNIRNPYNTSQTTSAELDLRVEIQKLLYGSTGEIPKGKIGLVRKMRMDENGDLIRCPCRNKITDEPDRDSFCRYCVVGSTMIPTSLGIRKATEIIPGMELLGSDGNFHLVTNTFGRLYEGTMVELNITGRPNMPLKLTADHRVFVYRNQNLCHQKKAFGKVCMPENCHVASCKTKTNNPDGFGFSLIEIQASEILDTDYLVMPRIKEQEDYITEISIPWRKYAVHKGMADTLPESITIDEDLMFLLGWFVAEGSGSHAGRKSRSVIYSLNKTKEQDIANRLLSIFENKFNIKGKIKESNTHDSMQVIFHNSILSRWLNDICGRYSDGKTVPDFIWYCESSMQKYFLDNFMLGDGHKDNQNWETAGIVSKRLAEELYIIANKLHYFPTISFRPAYTGSSGQAHSDSWIVSWLDSQAKNEKQLSKWRLRFNNDDFIVSSISSINKSTEICAVYDFTVSDVHSFVADGILIHNCHNHGYFWDETQIVYYKNDDSFRKREGKTQEYEGDLFYLEYLEDISPHDFIIEIVLNKDGQPTYPIQRLKTYDILSADQFRADNGRTEFWQIRAKYQRKWSVWYGIKNRQLS